MKKILLLLTFIFISTATWAVKAYPFPVTVQQSDGTQLTILIRGDEHYHWYTTEDGVILCRKGNDYYIALVNSNGDLEATTQLAHNKDKRSEAEQQLVAKQNKVAFKSSIGAKRARRKASVEDEIYSDASYFPHKGSPKAVVILAEFQDTPFTVTNPRRSFNQYLNGKGRPQNYDNQEDYNYSSVGQYFADMSFNQFTPQFDIYGPVKLPHNSNYYGENSSNATDINFFDLVKDACTLMNDSLDFSKYDSNNDGLVDLVYVVYAGYAESMTGNSADCIWPKSGYHNYGTFDGKQVARYGVNNELNGNPPYTGINGIGLFCHEFSHTLGLPDLYQSTQEHCDNNQEMEFWDLMDSGEYCKNGWYPAPYTAWEREAMGWMEIETLTSEAQIQLTPIQEGGKAYRIVNDNAPNEYYIIENIQERGWYDVKSSGKSIRGHGMLVYHVDYNKDLFRLSSLPNSVKGHPRMTVVAADGLLQSYDNSADRDGFYLQMNGDPFPGISGVTSLNDDMKRQDGKSMLFTYTGKLNKPIFNIKEDENGVITFDFLKDFSGTGISKPIYTHEEQDSRIFTLDGRYAGTDINTLPKGIYIMGKKKVYVK